MLLYHLYVETHFNHTMPGLRNSATPSSQCSPTKFPLFLMCAIKQHDENNREFGPGTARCSRSLLVKHAPCQK